MTEPTNNPNIFKYATTELSQDAVICWLLSFYNDNNSKLYDLARDLLKLFVKLDAEDNKIEIKQQFKKIDILIHLPNTKKVVIIEDKKYTSEHDEQISKYVKEISDDKNYEGCELYIVYFKTGFYYDNDKLVEYKYSNDFDNNFRSIHGEDFLKILQKYKNIDATLDMYIEYLDNLIRWYDIYGKFYKKNNNEWNVSNEYIAQYKLMRELFPEDDYWKNKDDKNKLYMIYSGSNVGGRPWTQMEILKGENYSIFWRIDTNKKGGPYLSLRYYNKYDKNNVVEHNKHTTEYLKYYEYIQKTVASICQNKEEEKKYYEFKKNEDFFEATLLHIHIEDILTKWDINKIEFIEKIRYITNEFINNVKPIL